MSLLRSFSSDTPDSGFLLTTVLSAQNNYPIDGASVSICLLYTSPSPRD